MSAFVLLPKPQRLYVKKWRKWKVNPSQAKLLAFRNDEVVKDTIYSNTI